MAEQKKSEVSEEGAERVGPYLIQEQVQQSDDSQEELYLATNETRGATALVRKHAAGEGQSPRKDWRVFLGSWTSRGYSAMEVEHTDWARAQDRQSAESLLLTLEGVLEEAQRMVRVVSASDGPRLRWHLGWGVASAVTVCTLLLTMVRLAPVSQPPRPLPSLPRHEVPMAGETADFDAWLADTIPQEQPVLSRPLPTSSRLHARRPSSSTRGSVTCPRSVLGRRPRHSGSKGFRTFPAVLRCAPSRGADAYR